ncbi:MAG TPA: hypothetical protein VFG76_12740 [Candidatus Polarisedimenticolia bacterium]|nr:hypothetical protein [Candidatus Polarisedimenticolia bacterium]
MANFPVTNHAVFPTSLDVHGGTPGLGTVWTEGGVTALFKAIGRQGSFIVAGFDPPTTGGGTLTKAIAGGEAVIDGYRVKGTASNNVTFDASTTNYLYLQLIVSGGVVAGLQLVTNTTGVKPANAVLIAKVVSNASNPTAVTDGRPEGRVSHGRIIRSGGNWVVDDYGSGDWTNNGAQINFGTAFRRVPHIWLFGTDTDVSLGTGGNAPTASSFVIVSTTTDGNFVSFLAML